MSENRRKHDGRNGFDGSCLERLLDDGHLFRYLELPTVAAQNGIN